MTLYALLFQILIGLIGGSPVAGGGTVATPTGSPGAGTYGSAQTVTLSDATGSAVICYTTDGSTPAATTPGTCSTGTTYSTTISVSATTTIKAIGTKAGMTNSGVLSSTYTITGGANTFTLVQHPNAPLGGSGSTISITLTQAITAGNALVFGTSASNNVTLSSTNNSGTFVHCSNCAAGNAGTGFNDGGYIISAGAQSSTITLTMSGAHGGMAACLWEVSATPGPITFDKSGSGLATSQNTPFNGQALAITGTSDFDAQFASTDINAITGVNSPLASATFPSGVGCASILNTSSGAATGVWVGSNGNAVATVGVALK